MSTFREKLQALWQEDVEFFGKLAEYDLQIKLPRY